MPRPFHGDVEFFRFNTTGGDAPVCALSLRSAGALRPGENESARKSFFESLSIEYDNVVSLSQVHSRDVYKVDETSAVGSSPWVFSPASGPAVPSPDDAGGGEGGEARTGGSGKPCGDGIVTVCRSAVPCVTVADCMPIWLFEPETGCFGVLHSGWKGTGIVAEALRAAESEWGCAPSSFYVILGPHIRQCCYTVDAGRAEYFRDAFGDECVAPDEAHADPRNRWPYKLSLAAANISVCLSLGVRKSRIVDVRRCTACSEVYGSSRRESSADASAAMDGRTPYTSMAAFIFWRKQRN